MNQTSSDVTDFLRASFAKAKRWNPPLHKIQGALLVADGMPLKEAAKAVGTTTPHLKPAVEAPDPVEFVLGLNDGALDQKALDRAKRKIGELVLGRAAEIAFEELFKAGIDPTRYSFEDVRAGRNNTDYILLSGSHRLSRFNVKFFGTAFQRALEMVGLDPYDCFPLAIYKIKQALEQEGKEHLSYVFAVVGVIGLNAAAVGEMIPEKDMRPLAMLRESKFVRRKFDFEDWMVDRIVEERSTSFTTAYERIKGAKWYVLSARRARNLLHELLFDRVHAVMVGGFTRNFPTAEVDMHFSLAKDMIALDDFLTELREFGDGKVTHMLTDGFW